MFLGYLRMLWSKVGKLPSQKMLVLQPVANLNMLLETLVQHDSSFHGQYVYKADVTTEMKPTHKHCSDKYWLHLIAVTK